MRVVEHAATPARRVLLLGDSEKHANALRGLGFDVVVAPDLGSLAEAAARPPEAVVAHWPVLGREPELACERIRALMKGAPLVLVGGDDADLHDAVQAMRTQADDFILEGQEPLATAIQRAIERCALRHRLRSLSERPSRTPTFEDLLGDSPPMCRLQGHLARMENADATVLLQGESGTGKDFVAKALHERGPRREGPFVTVNCAALPPQLLESEFFGHVKGAFTCAREANRGLLVAAHRGTLVLDEVGAMPMELQPKLLRALQERRIRPLGGSEELAIDVRVIAASNVDLDMRVQQGQFRRDLYYRLAVIELTLPPLRERGEDVLLLAQHFLWRVATSTHAKVVGFTPAAAKLLLRYHWPGNVRELQNAVEAAVAVARFDHIRDTDLPQRLHQDPNATPDLLPLDQIERMHISRVMHSVGGNKAEAARLLGITRKTLYRKLRQHDVDVPIEANDSHLRGRDRLNSSG